MSTRKGPAEAGDNSDPAMRAEMIRGAMAELMAIDEDKAEFNAKMKKRRDKSVATFKTLGFKMADVAQAYRAAQLRDQADNSEKAEDREKAERSLKVMIATFTECYAAVEEAGQLDFDEILNEGQEARKAEKKAPEAKVGKVKGGAQKDVAKAAH